MGAPGALGALGAEPGAFGAADAGASGAPGNAALQNGQVTGVKFGDTIFLPHSGQTSGPWVTSGGLKHIVFSFSS